MSGRPFEPLIVQLECFTISPTFSVRCTNPNRSPGNCAGHGPSIAAMLSPTMLAKDLPWSNRTTPWKWLHPKFGTGCSPRISLQKTGAFHVDDDIPTSTDFFFCGQRPLPFGGSHCRRVSPRSEAYPWTSGDSMHHRQSVCAAKSSAIPTWPRPHLPQLWQRKKFADEIIPFYSFGVTTFAPTAARDQRQLVTSSSLRPPWLSASILECYGVPKIIQ